MSIYAPYNPDSETSLDVKKFIKQLIAKNEIMDALRILLEYTEDTEVTYYNEAIMISANYHEFLKEKRRSKLLYAEVQQYRTGMIEQMLELVDLLPKF